MDRCWLQGALGDALHAISCAAGYNLRWLLRAIARLSIRALFCVCCWQRWSSRERWGRHTAGNTAGGQVSRAIGSQMKVSKNQFVDAESGAPKLKVNFAVATMCQ